MEILNHLVQKIVKIEDDNNILKKEISDLKRYLKEKTENHKDFLETSIEEKNMFYWYHTKFKGNALKCSFTLAHSKKTYAQKPKIRTFYNSKIKKVHKKNYVEEITTPIQKGEIFHKNIDCNNTKTEFFEITQATKKQSQTKTSDKEIQTQSIVIRKFRDNYSQTKDTEHNQLKPILREMYTYTSINKNKSIQTNTENCNNNSPITIEKESQTQMFCSDKYTSEKQVQTLEPVNIESTDKYSQTANTIITQASSISREVDTPTIEDDSSQIDTININKISQNPKIITTDKQININLSSETEKIINMQEQYSEETNSYLEINKLRKINAKEQETNANIYKDFLALVKNNTNDRFDGPYQIMEQQNKSFILNI